MITEGLLFDQYLQNLENIGIETREASNIRKIWKDLVFLLGGKISKYPISSPTELGFIMEWRTSAETLSVEILKDGSIDWFYRNRETNCVGGSEDPTTNFNFSTEELEKIKKFIS